MAYCSACGEMLAAGSWTCTLCGATVPPSPTKLSSRPPAQSPLLRGEVLPPGTRLCPGCGQAYGADYADMFCACGLELFRADQLPAAIIDEEVPPEAPTKP